ncbi:winged helix DNA-binding domain-containing protein [Gordonia amicalis]|uniref:Winged helix DNA-binding domain-containing protein n=1 Tax=Gordonia amicalis TaxID=89053 RepID=A0ABU4DGX3_9ACTN|nr:MULTISPECIES: winged helix DNA-binding domain-containing protein [Gordonia]ATD69471.1 winged helix DNA-binding domain-containing protein [Gordonia sp. 1D]MCZ4650041.1 winged helix DNA-binding domain-containing protein [Gordonia amicalis]MDV6308983.1 winged helix DNA-binding domain-containing protein [Gordonia amicalis]UKO92991.1 winged helix DNA-binding domain-containing protein [Gordonia amicalis]UOG20686.1 winged helix DNA-binding domain-containing protein [Gordonia amicalis]
MPVRPRITDAQRRSRLMRRMHLDAASRAPSAVDAARTMVGLHSTTPSTVYLSAWARVDGLARTDIDTALYGDRTLVRHLAMRRTLFAFPRDLLAESIGALGPRISASERTNMLRDLRRTPEVDDPEGWIETARDAVLAELAGGESLTSTELRGRLPALDGSIIFGEGKSWAGKSHFGPRVLNMLDASGDIVRGPNRLDWHLSRPAWTSMKVWLGETPDVPSVHDGHKALIERWLRTYGPGTETDIVWWLGSTKTAVRVALADLGTVEVDLDGGGVGHVLPDDLPGDSDNEDGDGDAEDCEPQAVLLPELDPTTMGFKERDFYLGDHGPAVFDSVGNGGQTAWWDGRIVGGWYRRDDNSIAIHPLEPLPAEARRKLDARAAELAAWLREAPMKIGYAAPYMRQR